MFEDRSSEKNSSDPFFVWTHGVAWAVLVVALATMVVGSLVTSYSAGMAVPDWPTTFGHNPFFYPPAKWLAVWDIFLEHSHRLLGFLLGGLTAVLAILLWRTDRRPTMRWLGLAVLAGYCVQEGLGGFRVLCDEILLANLHACAGPLVLAVAAAVVFETRPGRRRATGTTGMAGSPQLRRWAYGAAAIVYAQILLGTQLRHLPVNAATEWFVLWIWLHLMVAGALVGVAIALFARIRRAISQRRGLRRRAMTLVVLVLVQLALGACTWVSRFGWPGWFTDLFGAVDYTVVAEGRFQVMAATAHVVVGSLCLVVALSLAMERD
jgi:heme a synthase